MYISGKFSHLHFLNTVIFLTLNQTQIISSEFYIKKRRRKKCTHSNDLTKKNMQVKFCTNNTCYFARAFLIISTF